MTSHILTVLTILALAAVILILMALLSRGVRFGCSADSVELRWYLWCCRRIPYSRVKSTSLCQAAGGKLQPLYDHQRRPRICLRLYDDARLSGDSLTPAGWVSVPGFSGDALLRTVSAPDQLLDLLKNTTAPVYITATIARAYPGDLANIPASRAEQVFVVCHGAGQSNRILPLHTWYTTT